MKRIIICADDYGQNNAISQAIITLVEKKRISAVSCLATAKNWLKHAQNLQPLRQQIDVGLHLNLTEGAPLTAGLAQVLGPQFKPLNQLLALVLLKRLSRQAIEAEIHAQIDQFVAGFGGLPDFLDGHQHCHHFPIVRDAVLNVYQARLAPHRAYVRSVAIPLKPANWRQGLSFKHWVIQYTGAKSFEKHLRALNIPHNTSFAGIYNFKRAWHYAELFPQFVAALSPGGLMMCHPGLGGAGETDAIAGARAEEYAYFLSEEFLQVLDRHQAVLSRFEQAI